MSVKLNNDQYLLWIKDPSISPYINIVYRNKNIHNDRILISTYINNDYKEPSIQNDRMSRKNILTDEALKNPVSFLNEIRRITFYNTSLREDIVKQINEYNLNKTPRLW